MTILDDQEYKNIISWLPHGKAFIIHQEKSFVRKTQYTNFARKLISWGFVRVNEGSEKGAYYHSFFQKGNYHMCMQMTCNSSLGNKNYHEVDATERATLQGALPDESVTFPGATNAVNPVCNKRHRNAHSSPILLHHVDELVEQQHKLFSSRQHLLAVAADDSPRKYKFWQPSHLVQDQAVCLAQQRKMLNLRHAVLCDFIFRNVDYCKISNMDGCEKRGSLIFNAAVDVLIVDMLTNDSFQTIVPASPCHTSRTFPLQTEQS